MINWTRHQLFSPHGASAAFQHPGSPGWPQQPCPSATRRQRLRISLATFSRKGIGWSRLVRKSENEGRRIASQPFSSFWEERVRVWLKRSRG
jgi:hypothetical protein